MLSDDFTKSQRFIHYLNGTIKGLENISEVSIENADSI